MGLNVTVHGSEQLQIVYISKRCRTDYIKVIVLHLFIYVEYWFILKFPN